MRRESAPSSDSCVAGLTVRLGALAGNYREVLRRAAPAMVAPVVKANAYGMGVAPVLKALASAGADSFFVARLGEGIEARTILPQARIFVLDGVAPGSAGILAAHNLTPVLNTLEEISEWSTLARAEGRVADAVLHLDTGMNRSGLSSDDLSALAGDPHKYLAGINIVLNMSHLSCADDPGNKTNTIQLSRFRAGLAALPPAPASLAASAGIELGRDFHFDLVRPGLAIYGGNPISSRPNPYRTVTVLTGRLIQIRHLAEGETVGYAGTFTARRPTTLAIVAAGYADGLIRAGGARGCAAIAGMRVPFAGRISMDLLALDATDIPSSLLSRGVEVEFLGDTIALENVAEASDTIAHEVLTAISPRVLRTYVND